MPWRISLSRTFTHTDSTVELQLNTRGSASLHSRGWLLLIWMNPFLLPQQRNRDWFTGFIRVVVNDVILVLRNSVLDVLLHTQIRFAWSRFIVDYPWSCTPCTFRSTLLLSYLPIRYCSMQRKGVKEGRRVLSFSFCRRYLLTIGCSTIPACNMRLSMKKMWPISGNVIW